MDAVPGRLTTLWFTPTTPGTYHLFCAEYCGTKHSGMIGQVIVMPPQEYERWMAANQPNVSLVEAGQRVFEQGQQCSSCHKEDGSGRGPALAGIFGTPRPLADGSSVVADENYLRESIMNPSAKVVRGFPTPSIMPTYQGTMSEERLIELVAYLKTLRPSRDE
jgi:cytochrome c oxidase subunit 2